MLVGLPVRLQRGSIGSITARIPWPNPLTSRLGFSATSIHLVLEVNELGDHVPTTDLSESLASLSESFVHEELDREEEEDLLRSIHAEAVPGSERYIPGGFDSAPRPGSPERNAQVDEASMFSALIERLVSRFSFDVNDIEIVLVKPRVARFTLQIAVIQCGGENQKTEMGDTLDPPFVDDPQSGYALFTQSLCISSIRVTTASLLPTSPLTTVTSFPIHTSPEVSGMLNSGPVTATQSSSLPPPIPASPSGSEIDDEATMRMAQSQFLHRGGLSLTESLDKSMYASAISEHIGLGMSSPPEDPIRRDESASSSAPSSDTTPLPPDDLILSLVEPIEITISMQHRAEQHLGPDQTRTNSLPVPEPRSGRLMSAKVSVGMIPLALKAQHIRDLLALGSSLSPRSAPGSTDKEDLRYPTVTPRPDVQVDIQIRGVAVLLLAQDVVEDAESSHPLSDFFARPQHVPAILPAFTRLLVDGIDISFSQRSQSASTKSPNRATHRHIITTLSAEVADVSLLCFYDTSLPSAYVQPILITDLNLPQQYSSFHHHPAVPERAGAVGSRKLPTFEVQDWTDPSRRVGSARLSSWRVRPPAPHHQRSGFGLSNVGLSTSPPASVDIDANMLYRLQEGLSNPRKAFKATVHSTVSLTRMASSEPDNTNIDIAPLHLFIDLSLMEASGTPSKDSRLLAFLDACLEAVAASTELDERVPDPLARSSAHAAVPASKLARQQVINDLNLGYDYDPESTSARARSDAKVKHTCCHNCVDNNNRAHSQKPMADAPPSSTKIILPMLRVQIRCPPPLEKAPRSGALVVDLHHVEATFSTSGSGDRRTRQARFSAGPDPEDRERARESGETDDVVGLGLSRVTVSYSPYTQRQALGIVSIGPGPMNSAQEATLQMPVEHEPASSKEPLRITVKQTKARAKLQSRMVVAVQLPSVSAVLSKPLIDGLQFFADDVSQLASRLTGQTQPTESREQSMIGSRFFARHGSRSTSVSEIHASASAGSIRSETVVKLELSQGVKASRCNLSFLTVFSLSWTFASTYRARV
jgi:autophagy-related protein 2